MKKNTEAFDEIEHIQEINNHISDALEQWANITTMADADEWAYLLSYSDVDCLNVIRLFFHVLSNRAIKDGILTEENTMGKITKFKETLHDTFGIDTIELTNKILHGTETN
jgi:hypothetical protein